VEGLGVGASFRNLAAGDTAERMWSAGLGMPVEEVPGLSFGAALKVMEADLYGDYGTGFGLDLSVRAALPVRVEWLEVDAAAGVEDAFGSVNWASGLREDIARQWRMGLAARIDGSLALLAEGRLVRGPSASEGIWAFGLEHALLVRGRACAIRIGWRDGTQRTGTLSAGLGVPLGQGMLEYAIAGAAQSQGYLHMVSARWQLGRAGADAGAGREPASSPSAPASSREGEVTPESDTLVAPSPYRVFSFPVRAPRAGRVEAWSVVILDAAGGVVWSVEGDGAPPSAVQWNGSTQRGELAPAGRYRCSLVLRGPGTFRSVSPGTGFRLVRPPEPARGAEPEGAGGY
jgi:opacity protein-like surface antigen